MIIKNKTNIILISFIIIFTLKSINLMQFLNTRTWVDTLSLTLLITIAFYWVIKDIINSGKHPLIILILLLFLIISISSTIIFSNSFTGISSKIRELFEISLWIFSFIISYISSKKYGYTIIPYYILSLMLFFIAISFINVYQIQLIMRNTTINSVYYLIVLLPCVFVLRQNYLKFIGVMIILSSVIVSLKRTGLLAVLFALFFYFISLFIIQSDRKKSILNNIGIFSILIFIISVSMVYDYLTDSYNIDWKTRIESAEKDGGNGREFIWMTTIKMQFESGPFEWIIGHGYNSVFLNSPVEKSAHNDFLEVLYDYGIIGFTLYLSFIFMLIIYAVRLKNIKSEITAPFISSIILFLVMSFSSHLLIYPTYFIFLTIFWGITIGQYESNKHNYIFLNGV